MDLLGLLNGGLSAVNRAKSAQLEGAGIKREREQADLLAEIESQRKAQADAQRTEAHELNKRNILDLIRERGEAPAVTPETFGTPFEAEQDGQRVFVERGNRGTTRTLQGYTPPQRTAPAASAGSAEPTRGTPEYLKMIQDEAAARSAGNATTAGATAVNEQARALTNAEDAISRLEASLALDGAAVMPGAVKSGQQTEYENLQLQMKELYRLGVLAGPDLMLMRRIVNEPGSWMTQASAALDPKNSAADIVGGQLKKLREIVRKYRANLPTSNAPADTEGDAVTTSTGRSFQRVNP